MDEAQIRVCVGNYGYYNEGELRDRWFDLPMDDAEIGRRLREYGLVDAEHEETYISDYDGVPFGMDASGIFGETARLEDLNLLAKVMREMTPAEKEAVEAYVGAMDTPRDLVELMNLCLQAEEIPFYAYECEGRSPEERFGYMCLELNQELSQALERDPSAMCAFDVVRYGQEMALDVSLLEDGYVDNTEDGPDLGWYGRDEIEGMYAGDEALSAADGPGREGRPAYASVEEMLAAAFGAPLNEPLADAAPAGPDAVERTDDPVTVTLADGGTERRLTLAQDRYVTGNLAIVAYEEGADADAYYQVSVNVDDAMVRDPLCNIVALDSNNMPAALLEAVEGMLGSFAMMGSVRSGYCDYPVRLVPQSLLDRMQTREELLGGLPHAHASQDARDAARLVADALEGFDGTDTLVFWHDDGGSLSLSLNVLAGGGPRSVTVRPDGSVFSADAWRRGLSAALSQPDAGIGRETADGLLASLDGLDQGGLDAIARTGGVHL